ncbi:hypothetical protein L3X38_027739 [Prunus dulcis]|uniref:Integrase catalytic domain-containing protein n=1 Tax=Prunus dulcis TaxID=3755 RepID=A0AAD4YZR7_PRUDU|nr:hypothetical protein L3X38_027739 [Prunus dulcis]
MEPSLLNMFHTLPTAKEIWDAVNQMFYDGSNISQLYELRCQATHPKQKGRPVSTHFAELKAIWLELDKRHHFQMKCVDDMKTFQDAVMADRMYDFLAGFDDTYDKVRNDILWSDKVPSIENVFFMVRREAQLQITMLGSGTKIGESTVALASKNTALVSRPPWFGSSTVPPRRLTFAKKKKKKKKLKCDHYGEKRHTIDTYWALHGVPDWEKEQRRLKREQLDSKAHVAVAPTSVADIATRHGPLTATPPPTLTAISSTPTPQPPGNFGKAFHAHDTSDTGWIIDSEATDHLMYNSTLFSTTLPPHRDHVLTTNNAAAPITGAGSLLLTPALPLDKVLLVPSLSRCIETTCPQTPQQNGVAERKNGQILAAAHALLLGALVPKGFWMDDVTYAVYLLNRLPSRVLDFQTPMQVLTHHLSASSMLTLSPKVFGCVFYVHLHHNQRSKLDPCALYYVFLGFSAHQKGY